MILQRFPWFQEEKKLLVRSMEGPNPQKRVHLSSLVSVGFCVGCKAGVTQARKVYRSNAVILRREKSKQREMSSLMETKTQS